jgi:hypothetical protein
MSAKAVREYNGKKLIARHVQAVANMSLMIDPF